MRPESDWFEDREQEEHARIAEGSGIDPEGLLREAAKGLSLHSDPDAKCCHETHALYLWWLFLMLRRPLSTRLVWREMTAPGGALAGRSRDELALGMWWRLRRRSCTVEPKARFIERHKHSLPYHEELVFSWFLARYDITRALQCFRDEVRWPARVVLGGWGVAALAGLLVVLLLWLFAPGSPHLGGWWRLLAVGAMYGAFAALLSRAGAVPWGLVLQALVPRLMGTAAVGYLFLLNTEEVFRNWLLPISRRWTLALPALLVLAAGTYLWLEIARRVDPAPKLCELATRTFRLLATGAAHSTALFIVTGPGFPLVHKGGQRLDGVEVLGLVAFVLTVGMVLNVIWAEEPVTAPM